MRWCKDIPTGQTLPNPDSARAIVRRPTDLPVAAGQKQSLGANPESLVVQLALQYSALNHCATREALGTILYS